MTNSEKCKALSALMGPNQNWQEDEYTSSRVIALSKAFGWHSVNQSRDTSESIVKLWNKGFSYKEIEDYLNISYSTVSHAVADYKREMRRK